MIWPGVIVLTVDFCPAGSAMPPMTGTRDDAVIVPEISAVGVPATPGNAAESTTVTRPEPAVSGCQVARHVPSGQGVSAIAGSPVENVMVAAPVAPIALPQSSAILAMMLSGSPAGD